MPEKRLESVLETGKIVPGQMAPDFELPALISGVRKPFRLSSLIGEKAVVLSFYPFNWQDATARQLIEYQAQRPRFQSLNSEVVAITSDSIMNTAAWERKIGPFDFPLCSDFWPHGEVCMKYGVLRESGQTAGSPGRTVFVINLEGCVILRRKYPDNETPPLEDIFAILEKL
jgi:peroxiredoxin